MPTRFCQPSKLILTSIPIEGEDRRESFPEEVTTQTEKNLSLQNLDLIETEVLASAPIGGPVYDWKTLHPASRLGRAADS